MSDVVGKAIVLIVGAVLANYAIGWSCTLWSDISHRTKLPEHHGDGYPATYPGGPEGKDGWWTTETALGYREYTAHSARGAEGSFTYWRGSFTLHREAGLPLASIRSTVTPQRDGKTGWDLPMSEVLQRGINPRVVAYWTGGHPERRLALVPKPLGFVFNMVVYMALFVLLRRANRAYSKSLNTDAASPRQLA